MSLERYNFPENNFHCWVYTTLDNQKYYKLREFVILLGHTNVWPDEDPAPVLGCSDQWYVIDNAKGYHDYSMESLQLTLKNHAIVDQKYISDWASLPCSPRGKSFRGKISCWEQSCNEPFIMEAGLREMLANSNELNFVIETVIPRVLRSDAVANQTSYGAEIKTHRFNGNQFLTYETLYTGTVYRLHDFAKYLGCDEDDETTYDVINKAELREWDLFKLKPRRFKPELVFISEIGLYEFVSKFELSSSDKFLSEIVLPRIRCSNYKIPDNVTYDCNITVSWNNDYYTYKKSEHSFE